MSFSIELGGLDQDQIIHRKTPGQRRYSSTLHRRGGGLIRRWTDDLAEAMAAHDQGRQDAELDWIITFDHLAEEDLACDFAGGRKSAQQLTAACDEALQAMWDRWLAEECAARGGGR